MRPKPRTELHGDPHGRFVHDLVLEACRRFSEKTALVDASLPEPRRISYAEYGETVERIARNLVAGGVRPGDVVAIYLPNSWEFCVSYHAVTLAGAVPTPLNPSYREREVRYQLENSAAAVLLTDAPVLQQTNLSGLPALRRVYMTRQVAGAASAFTELLRPTTTGISSSPDSPTHALAALPFSSGTTGLPKGVMLSHSNLVTNVYQTIPAARISTGDVTLGFLPLYHIYGLNVVLNPVLTVGGKLVLLPRFDLDRAMGLIPHEGVTWVPMVPPVMNALCVAAEQGRFPREHRVRRVQSGAAPLAPELARRFTSLTGIPVTQGYGMTEASPVTHIGTMEPYRPDSIGIPVALTDCRLMRDDTTEAAPGEPGELVMRGPQFMLGYWNNAEATAAVLRDGWY
ncbi:MAG: AMP-binding protein [Acidobacteriia bacterium]|nr:AMP-binding protein [Terriglobia bacterium]